MTVVPAKPSRTPGAAVATRPAEAAWKKAREAARQHQRGSEHPSIIGAIASKRIDVNVEPVREQAAAANLKRTALNQHLEPNAAHPLRESSNRVRRFTRVDAFPIFGCASVTQIHGRRDRRPHPYGRVPRRICASICHGAPQRQVRLCANFVSNDVSGYTIDGITGFLTFISGGPYAAGSLPFSITLDPSGKFVYVANSGSDNVSGYIINPATGALTSIGAFPAGSEPLSIVTVTPPPSLLNFYWFFS